MKHADPDNPPYVFLLIWFCLFIFGMFVQHRLHKSRCPRCHDYFFVQGDEKSKHLPPMSSISFPPQKQCQKCGLELYH